MKKLLLLFIVLLTFTPILAQTGEIRLSWDAVPLLCSGATPIALEYHAFWSLAPRPIDIAPPNYYENTAIATPGEVQIIVPNLLDCTNYYFAVAAKEGVSWSGCSQTSGPHIDGYSTEIVGWARTRLTSSNITMLEQGKNYTLTILGANFQDGIFTDSISEIIYNTPVVIDCQTIEVIVNVPIAATLGSVDVLFERFDTVSSDPVVGFLEVIANQDAPFAPTNIRRTQP